MKRNSDVSSIILLNSQSAPLQTELQTFHSGNKVAFKYEAKLKADVPDGAAGVAEPQENQT